MLNACEIAGFASTSTLTTSTDPSYFCASRSSSGETIRHGPHQAAQKSTTTGFSFFRTISSKVASVAFLTSTTEIVPFCRVRGLAALAGETLDEAISLEDARVREAVVHGVAVTAALD